MKFVNFLFIGHIISTTTAQSFFGQVYGNTKNIGHKIAAIARNFTMNSI
jgi:hypothetical protein